jgi:hypothetical protein
MKHASGSHENRGGKRDSAPREAKEAIASPSAYSGFLISIFGLTLGAGFRKSSSLCKFPNRIPLSSLGLDHIHDFVSVQSKVFVI